MNKLKTTRLYEANHVLHNDTLNLLHEYSKKPIEMMVLSSQFISPQFYTIHKLPTAPTNQIISWIIVKI